MARLTSRLVRAVLISAAVATLTALAAVAVSYLLFPVTGMQITGARAYPESEAWKALPDHASLASLNTDALKRRIESNPWVEGAEVIKDWDSGIVTVEVQERRPVLSGDLEGRRVVVSADGTELPGLGGADLVRVGLEDEARLEEILSVGELLGENGAVLDSVDGVGAAGVEATVEGRRVLFADGVDEGQAREIEGFMRQHPDAPFFDLRSPGKIVVGAEQEASAETQVERPPEAGAESLDAVGADVTVEPVGVPGADG